MLSTISKLLLDLGLHEPHGSGEDGAPPATAPSFSPRTTALLLFLGSNHLLLRHQFLRRSNGVLQCVDLLLGVSLTHHERTHQHRQDGHHHTEKSSARHLPMPSNLHAADHPRPVCCPPRLCLVSFCRTTALARRICAHGHVQARWARSNHLDHSSAISEYVCVSGSMVMAASPSPAHWTGNAMNPHSLWRRKRLS